MSGRVIDQLLEQLRPVAPLGTGTDGPVANIVTPGLPPGGFAACLVAKGDGGVMVVDDAPARNPTGELSQGLAAALGAMPSAGTPYFHEDLLDEGDDA